MLNVKNEEMEIGFLETIDVHLNEIDIEMCVTYQSDSLPKQGHLLALIALPPSLNAGWIAGSQIYLPCPTAPSNGTKFFSVVHHRKVWWRAPNNGLVTLQLTNATPGTWPHSDISVESLPSTNAGVPGSLYPSPSVSMFIKCIGK